MTLLETLDQAKNSLFRFEYLQSFSVHSEIELWDTWQKERRINEECMKEWWQYLANKKQNGVNMQRVSFVRLPLSPYKEMEIEIFKKTLPYGDGIRIITEDKFNKLNIILQDFWLIDESKVVDLHYDIEGKWLGFDVSDDVTKYLKAKRSLLANSMPLLEFSNIQI